MFLPPLSRKKNDAKMRSMILKASQKFVFEGQAIFRFKKFATRQCPSTSQHVFLGTTRTSLSEAKLCVYEEKRKCIFLESKNIFLLNGENLVISFEIPLELPVEKSSSLARHIPKESWKNIFRALNTKFAFHK
jgi:hypothetical protein